MLTKQIIRHATPRERVFKLFDGGGLFLLVRPTGHHGWRFKYRVRGREKLLSFGPPSSLAGPFGRPALARHRRVKGATSTRLPDSWPKRHRVRCHVLVAKVEQTR